jgi:hypothetical protein
MENTMATTRKPKVAKTSAELKKELELARKKVDELERKAYAGELKELINKSGVVAAITDIKTKVKEATDIAILTAIANAAGFKRLVVTQTAAPARKTYPKKPKTPKAASK